MVSFFRKFIQAKSFFFLLLIAMMVAIGCDKEDDKKESEQFSTGVLNENTIIVSGEIYSSLVTVDESQLAFNDNEKTGAIKEGSILVSDISEKAPDGFLRKVISIDIVNGQKVCKTELSSLSEALKSAKVKFTKNLTDADLVSVDSSGVDTSEHNRQGNLSFKIPFNKSFGSVDVTGEFDLHPALNLELSIDNSKISYFKAELVIQNTNTINFKSALASGNIREQKVLATYALAPYTVWVGPFPVPMAKQWVVIVMGIDGKITAKISTGASNVNTIKAGIEYSGGIWKSISESNNTFQKKPLDFEGKAKAEIWLQARYEIRPYAIPSSRIFLAAKGSVIGEVKAALGNSCKLTATLDWGVELSAKAQMIVFDRTIANYENTFYSSYYSIYKKDISSLKAETLQVMDIAEVAGSIGSNRYTAKSGGILRDSLASCNTTVLERGVCWDTIAKPTILKSRSSDGTGKGNFVSQLTNLKGGKTYFARAFARTDSDTIYGNEKEFKTPVHVKIDFPQYFDVNGISYFNNRVIHGIRYSYASPNVSMINESTFKDCFETDYYPSFNGSGVIIADITGLENVTKISVVMYDNCGINCSKVTVCNKDGLIDKVTNTDSGGGLIKTFNVSGKNPKTVIFSTLEGFPISLEIE